MIFSHYLTHYKIIEQQGGLNLNKQEITVILSQK